MTPFNQEEFNWQRIDVQAIVGFQGLAVFYEANRDSAKEWLQEKDYVIDSVDCMYGIPQILIKFNVLLEWERQFGYSLQADNLNLDALHDGFNFDVPEFGGRVLELVRPDIPWQQDAKWLMGLLSIAREHSRYHQAFGRRFFTMLILPEGSPLIGTTIESITVPGSLNTRGLTR